MDLHPPRASIELTLSAYDGIEIVEVGALIEVLVDLTLIVTSFMHAAPFAPHAFTCRV
jgi:hypothetical protein